MYETIKKFLDEGGKCLLIENGKPVGVVLTMEEYDRLKPETRNPESEIDLPPQIPPVVLHPIGDAMIKEMNFPEEALAELADINIANDISDVTLEDLGLDPDIQLPKDF